MLTVPPEYPATLDTLLRKLSAVDGWMSDREVHFLATLAACPTAEGRVVELGAFLGKSTITLAHAAQLNGPTQIVSVDIHNPAQLQANLRTADVSQWVDFRHMPSEQFTASWNEPIRLLLHDGANCRKIVAADMEGLLPWLADGAIVAMDDVLNPSGERIHVFLDKILGSEHFGASGVCGAIGWARYHADVESARPFQSRRKELARKLQRLAPYHVLGLPKMWGLRKYRYKLARARVPHAELTPDQWLKQVA